MNKENEPLPPEAVQMGSKYTKAIKSYYGMDNKMKKILIITTVGGFLTQFEMNDVKILKELGYEIQYASNFDNPVYTIDENLLKKNKIKKHQIPIKKHPIYFINNIKALCEIIDIIKREKINVIHCHNPMGGVVGRIAGALLGKQKPILIYTAHGFHFYKGAPLLNWVCYYPVEKLLARYTDYLITINHEDYNRGKKFYRPEKSNKVYCIPGVGVDVVKYGHSTKEMKQIKKELGVPEDKYFILSVGEVNQNKNHQLMLQVIKALEDRPIYYGICGKGNGEEVLQKKIEELKLENKVQLFGYRNDIPDILASADCFTFPSKREGFGIAAIEAMAAGLPVIASDCRGTREYMHHGKNGFLCDINRIDTFIDAVCRLLDDQSNRNIMKEKCKQTAADFSIDETEKIMRVVYNQLP